MRSNQVFDRIFITAVSLELVVCSNCSIEVERYSNIVEWAGTPERGRQECSCPSMQECSCPSHAPPAELDAGGGEPKSALQSTKIVLPFAKYKLAYNILTAVETVLLTNSSLVHCIFLFSKEFEITNFFFLGGGGYVTHAVF